MKTIFIELKYEKPINTKGSAINHGKWYEKLNKG
jgi:hypothetical protein